MGYLGDDGAGSENMAKTRGNLCRFVDTVDVRCDVVSRSGYGSPLLEWIGSFFVDRPSPPLPLDITYADCKSVLYPCF